MAKTKKKVFPKEIWVNSVLVGAISFLSAVIVLENFTMKAVIVALAAAGIVCLTRLKAYTDTKKDSITKMLFNLIP